MYNRKELSEAHVSSHLSLSYKKINTKRIFYLEQEAVCPLILVRWKYLTNAFFGKNYLAMEFQSVS